MRHSEEGWSFTTGCAVEGVIRGRHIGSMAEKGGVWPGRGAVVFVIIEDEERA
jgi:hypothetical protein